MAIDSDIKRNSALLDPGNMPWPPDGIVGAADRLVMLEFYYGLTAASTGEAIVCLLDAETLTLVAVRPDVLTVPTYALDTLSVPAHAADVLAVPVVVRDTLAIAVVPSEVLQC